jgi:hypothetical protein
MKYVKYHISKHNRREVEVPENWKEALDMLEHSMKNYNERRGGNNERMSVACRVAFGMFNPHGLIPDPTHALMYLMMEICKRKGAGLGK